MIKYLQEENTSSQKKKAEYLVYGILIGVVIGVIISTGISFFI
ncbi:MAG TPA: hypothetical protein VNX01_05810 [Bacteroidia bacterium]|nr:hypothetical protein [Bacteroidia bacterium]